MGRKRETRVRAEIGKREYGRSQGRIYQLGKED